MRIPVTQLPKARSGSRLHPLLIGRNSVPDCQTTKRVTEIAIPEGPNVSNRPVFRSETWVSSLCRALVTLGRRSIGASLRFAPLHLGHGRGKSTYLIRAYRAAICRRRG